MWSEKRCPPKEGQHKEKKKKKSILVRTFHKPKISNHNCFGKLTVQHGLEYQTPKYWKHPKSGLSRFQYSDTDASKYQSGF